MSAQIAKRVVVVPKKGSDSVSLAMCCTVVVMQLWGDHADYTVSFEFDFDVDAINDETLEYYFLTAGARKENFFEDFSSIECFSFAIDHWVPEGTKRDNLTRLMEQLSLYERHDRYEVNRLYDPRDQRWVEHFKAWEGMSQDAVLATIQNVLENVADGASVEDL